VNGPASAPAVSGRYLDEIPNHTTSAPVIRPITLRQIQGVVVAAVNSHEKISVTDETTVHSDAAGMNHPRPAEVLAEVLMRVDMIDTKTELSATNLAFRGVILHRPTTNPQNRTNGLQFEASR
jgi:hypothetical protein